MITFGLDVPAFPPASWDQSPRSYYSELVGVAEDAGFDRLWMGDHALWHQPRYETFAILSLLAGQTELGLGTAILLAPLRRPVWIAKMAATVDHLNDGQFVLGVGVGGEHEAEFELLGVDRGKRGRLTDRAIETCRSAWAGHLHETFSPLPRSQIPIWIGGRSEAALRRAGELGDGYIGLFVSPDRFRDSVEQMREHATNGNRASALTPAMAIWCAVGPEDGEAVRRRARERIEAEYHIPGDRFQRYLAAGSPTQVAATLTDYVAAGAEHIHLHIAHENTLDQVRVVGEKVLPLVRSDVPSGRTT